MKELKPRNFEIRVSRFETVKLTPDFIDSRRLCN